MALFISPPTSSSSSCSCSSSSLSSASSSCLLFLSESNCLPHSFSPECLSVRNVHGIDARDIIALKGSLSFTNASALKIGHASTEKRTFWKNLIVCQATKIDQTEFTDMARQAVVGPPEVAKESKHQIADTEQLMKALLEQRKGVAQHMFVKANVDKTELLQAPERFIQTQLEGSFRSNVAYRESRDESKFSCLKTQPPLTKIEEHQCFADVQDLVSLEDKKNELAKELGRAPTHEEWANYVGCSIYQLYARVGKARAAKRKMIKANLPLVSSIAKEFQGRGLSHQELFQEGAKGLMKSTEKFDISFDTKFSTYSYFWIRQKMSAAVYTLRNLLVTARSTQKTVSYVLQCKDEFREMKGRNPSMDELSAFSKISKTKIKQSLFAIRSSKALNYQRKNDEDYSDNVELEDKESDLSWMKLLQNELKDELGIVFSQLSPRELQVVKMKYGLFGGSPQSLVQIAAALDISHEAVRMAEKRALRKLRRSADENGLHHYLRATQGFRQH